ncbi:MAG: hypothetical protein LUE93_08540 [Bacteroides sp.]|nr:hypothetical protein [Bacteroides sp.]
MNKFFSIIVILLVVYVFLAAHTFTLKNSLTCNIITMNLSPLSISVFQIESGSREALEKLKELVDNSDIMYRDEIQEVIGKDHEADIHKKQTTVLDEGRVLSESAS